MITNMDNWDQLKKLKHIDFDSGKFEANGKIYYLESQLTIARYCEFQILEKELGMGMTLKEFYDGLMTQRQLLNQTRFVDCAVWTDKMILHCAKLKEKEPTVLKFCTLFCNIEDEDRNTWGNDLVVKKMEDWKQSGIDVKDFFVLALTLAPRYIEIYNDFTQSISEKLGIAKEVVSALAEMP